MRRLSEREAWNNIKKTLQSFKHYDTQYICLHIADLEFAGRISLETSDKMTATIKAEAKRKRKNADDTGLWPNNDAGLAQRIAFCDKQIERLKVKK